MNDLGLSVTPGRDIATVLNSISGLKWAFYRQDEGTGTTLADAGGNAPDLTINNPGNAWTNAGWLTWDTTTYCQALGNDYLDALLAPNGKKQITISFQLYVDGSGAANVAILSYGRVTSGQAGGYVLTIIDAASTWRLSSTITDTSGTQISGATSGESLATGGNIYDIVFDWDVENNATQWYIDGTPAGNTKVDAPDNLPGAAATGGFVLGARFGSSVVDSEMGTNYPTLDLRTAGLLMMSRTDKYDPTLPGRIASLRKKYSLPTFLGGYS
ncbi:MAG: hypothetical protein KJO69_03195 [Gammaproteobacteria bacterium]|nr:hypothetical protein [Gammaproteobacteria bacterium]